MRFDSRPRAAAPPVISCAATKFDPLVWLPSLPLSLKRRWRFPMPCRTFMRDSNFAISALAHRTDGLHVDTVEEDPRRRLGLNAVSCGMQRPHLSTAAALNGRAGRFFKRDRRS